MKKLTRSEMKALSIAVMCMDRFPELYTKEHIDSRKKEYADKLLIFKTNGK